MVQVLGIQLAMDLETAQLEPMVAGSALQDMLLLSSKRRAMTASRDCSHCLASKPARNARWAGTQVLTIWMLALIVKQASMQALCS